MNNNNQKPGLKKLRSGKGVTLPDNFGKGLSRSARKAKRGHGKALLPMVQKGQQVIQLAHGYRVI